MKDIECKILTPLLIHGENPKAAELRPPSIKGTMRFWWRAIHGNLSLDELKRQESMLFGGAGEDNAFKSPFRIKLLTNNLQIVEVNPLPHKQNSHFRINGYKENQNFRLEFIGKDIETIEKIFKLTTILGGFGQRSRRGFGSIQAFDTEETTEETIKQLINNINKDFKYDSSENYPYIQKINISKKGDSDFNKVLKKIGSATHKHANFCIGSANPRYASPIYVSIIKKENKYFPIITTLNYKCENKIEAFKKDILS